MKYSIEWVRGDYPARQAQANKAKCVAYVCMHFNAKENDNPNSTEDNAAMVIVSSNASAKSKAWAADLLIASCAEIGTRSVGVVQRKLGERGDVCLRYTEMPAILPELLYVSDPTNAAIALSADGQRKLGRLLADSIIKHFPGGGRIGFSVGHKYKTSQPYDRGAPIVGSKLGEADVAEKVLEAAAEILEGVGEEEPTSPHHLTERPGTELEVFASIVRREVKEAVEDAVASAVERKLEPAVKRVQQAADTVLSWGKDLEDLKTRVARIEQHLKLDPTANDAQH